MFDPNYCDLDLSDPKEPTGWIISFPNDDALGKALESASAHDVAFRIVDLTVRFWHPCLGRL